jgi:hypothetical protein
LRLLQHDLEDPSGVEARQRRFAERFVRPHGIDLPAQPFLLEAILASARAEPNPVAPSAASLAFGWAVLGPWIAQDRTRVVTLRAAAGAGIRLGAALKARGARLSKQSLKDGSHGRLSRSVRGTTGRRLVWTAGVLQEGGRIARRRLKNQGERLPVIEKPAKERKPPKRAKSETPKTKAPRPVKVKPSKGEKAGSKEGKKAAARTAKKATQAGKGARKQAPAGNVAGRSKPPVVILDNDAASRPMDRLGSQSDPRVILD